MGALELSPLRLPTLHSGSSPALPCTRTFNFWEIFKRAFQIYGIWPQARMLQTHFCNAVLLVWGSLRLAPIILLPIPKLAQISELAIWLLSNYIITSKYTITSVVYWPLPNYVHLASTHVMNALLRFNFRRSSDSVYYCERKREIKTGEAWDEAIQ